MIYLLLCVQNVILEKNLQKLLKENFEVLDDFNLVKFDARETCIKDIIYEASSSCIGYDKKAVIVKYPYFLSTEKEKIKFEEEQDFELLKNYINAPNENTDLIFYANYSKLNEKNEIVKLLRSKATIIEKKDASKEEWPQFVKKYFEKLGATIDIDAQAEIINRTHGDLQLFTNEAEKLVLYTTHITKNDVELFVAKPLDDNAFSIFDNLIKGKNEVAIAVYHDLLIEAEEPVRLISLLATQFRFMAQVLYLRGEGMSAYDIANNLNVKEFRCKLAIDNARYVSYGRLVTALDELYNLDYSIKSMAAPDRFYAFELFLLRFKSKK